MLSGTGLDRSRLSPIGPPAIREAEPSPAVRKLQTMMRDKQVNRQLLQRSLLLLGPICSAEAHPIPDRVHPVATSPRHVVGIGLLTISQRGTA